MNKFNQEFAELSGGTYSQTLPVLDEGNIFSIYGIQYTGYTTSTILQAVNVIREDYPIDNEGYPNMTYESEQFYFQKGSGWFEITRFHQKSFGY